MWRRKFGQGETLKVKVGLGVGGEEEDLSPVARLELRYVSTQGAQSTPSCAAGRVDGRAQPGLLTETEEKLLPSTFTRWGPSDAIACEDTQKPPSSATQQRCSYGARNSGIFFLKKKNKKTKTFLIAVQSSRISRSCSM